MTSETNDEYKRFSAARAMAYLELFGPPRAMRAYEGPPSAD